MILRGTPSPLDTPEVLEKLPGISPSRLHGRRDRATEHGQWRKSPAEPDFFREFDRRTAVRRCLRLRERQEKGTPDGCAFLYMMGGLGKFLFCLFPFP